MSKLIHLLITKTLTMKKKIKKLIKIGDAECQLTGRVNPINGKTEIVNLKTKQKAFVKL